jgi:hypothetical protein
LFEKCGTLGAREREAAISRRERIEEFARAFADALCLAQQRRGAEAQHAESVIDVAREFLEAIVRNLAAEVIAGDVFHLVSFVENDC